MAVVISKMWIQHKGTERQRNATRASRWVYQVGFVHYLMVDKKHKSMIHKLNSNSVTILLDVAILYYFPGGTFQFIFPPNHKYYIFLRRNSKRVDPTLHLTSLGKTSCVCCVLCRVWRRAMDDKQIDHGPETTPPLVANHGGGDIGNPDVMSGIVYGRIDWKGSSGD